MDEQRPDDNQETEQRRAFRSLYSYITRQASLKGRPVMAEVQRDGRVSLDDRVNAEAFGRPYEDTASHCRYVGKDDKGIGHDMRIDSMGEVPNTKGIMAVLHDGSEDIAHHYLFRTDETIEHLQRIRVATEFDDDGKPVRFADKDINKGILDADSVQQLLALAETIFETGTPAY